MENLNANPRSLSDRGPETIGTDQWLDCTEALMKMVER